MPIMERAASSDTRSVSYQCGTCHHVVRVVLGRPGDRSYQERIPCPRCAYRAMMDNQGHD